MLIEDEKCRYIDGFVRNPELDTSPGYYEWPCECGNIVTNNGIVLCGWCDGFIDLCTQHGKLAEYTAAQCLLRRY
jgi:hypothetical protein